MYQIMKGGETQLNISLFSGRLRASVAAVPYIKGSPPVTTMYTVELSPDFPFFHIFYVYYGAGNWTYCYRRARCCSQHTATKQATHERYQHRGQQQRRTHNISIHRRRSPPKTPNPRHTNPALRESVDNPASNACRLRDSHLHRFVQLGRGFQLVARIISFTLFRFMDETAFLCGRISIRAFSPC